MTEIQIEQDHEYDSGEVGGPLAVFWCKGHGHSESAFIRAVLDYCLDNDVDIPAIRWDDRPVESWQQNVAHQDGIEYRRDLTPPTSPRSSRFPITILDLEGPRRHGATKCAVNHCNEPWGRGAPVRVVVEPSMGSPYYGDEHMDVTLWLCREHAKRLPEPSYRVCLVPVGAVITLEAKDESAGLGRGSNS